MAADLQHYESGTGKKQVRKLGPGEKSSESKKSKPGESSGETGHARPRSQLRPHQRRPGTDTLSGDTKLPPDMCHCGLLCPTLSDLAIHIQNAHFDGLYVCIHCGTQLSTKRIAWKHVRTVHFKRFLHRCMYMDAKNPTKECSYGYDDVNVTQCQASGKSECWNGETMLAHTYLLFYIHLGVNLTAYVLFVYGCTDIHQLLVFRFSSFHNT